jgi:FdhD protein
MSWVTTRRRVLRIRDGQAGYRPDTLAVEEPMEIRVADRPLAVTMRTPGDDVDLATGFLVSEGVAQVAEHIAGIRYCPGATADGSNTYNIVDVVLAPHVAPPDSSLERNFYTTSSCGLCGKAGLDAVRTTAAWSVAVDGLCIEPETLAVLPERLQAAQRVFDTTGGLHAAGLFTAEGELLCLRRTSAATTPSTRSSATPVPDVAEPGRPVPPAGLAG